ncbi:MAG: RNA methyltransferase [bacterium]|nr:RNA methyltransferase [bacterium]
MAVTPPFDLDRLPTAATPLLLIADTIEKPGNLGAMIRSADGAGTTGLIAADFVTDLVNPNTIRASQGAVFSTPVAAAPGDAVRVWLQHHQIRTIAATAAATTSLWDTDLTGPLAIVVGSEHAGLSPAWHSAQTVSIPMAGISDSLNASVAAAVMLYEAVRQRASI